MNTAMTRYGFNDSFLAESSLYPGLCVGRVISQHKDLYKVVCDDNELLAEISGKFRFEAKALVDFPAVGDFVMLDRNSDENGTAIIQTVLSRKSAFIRKSAGTANENQIIASNIDTVFICMSLNKDFNPRRIERYLSVAWDSGALPVVVLTKADLCDDTEEKLPEVKAVAIGVDVLVTSGLVSDGFSQVLGYIREGQTIAFIGSSGVGKSTLINRLIGDNIMRTNGLRSDDKGRHTTTSRELIMLDCGAMVIDTPGIREIGMDSADLTKSFADIDALSALCKFSDCTHTNEPNCAVQNAIYNGVLSHKRFSNYQKLKKEVGYEGLNSKQIENIKLNEMFKDVGGMKKARKFAKDANNRKHGG